MRILLGCERRGIGRRLFSSLGHEVWSCDLLPSFDHSPFHVICDIRNGILEDGWDLAILHPPCTRLCRSGRHWMSGAGQWTQPKRLPKGRTLEEVREEFELGVEIFTACWRAPIEKVAIENAVMSDLARARMPIDLPKPQIVQPFWFGDEAYKKTAWYLRGLPHLAPTRKLTEPEKGSEEWELWHFDYRRSPGSYRASIRSRSHPGMMEAAAMQWAGMILK